MSDGTELRAPMAMPHPWQDLSFAETDLATGELTIRLHDGETLVMELGGDDDVPAPGRPVVYLDQRHWITLAQRLHNPSAIAQADRQPAEHLIELSRSKTLVFPLSSANFVGNRSNGPSSTGRCTDYGRAFARVAVARSGQRSRTGAQACHGRREPSASGGGDHPGARRNLQRRLFASGPRWAAGRLARVSERMANAEASLAAMLEDHPPEEAQQRRSVAAAWAEPHHLLAIEMRNAGIPREHVRLNTLGRLASDLRTEIAEAARATGMGHEQFAGWLRDDLDQAIETMPYARTLREVLYHRLSNADDHWSGNDLADSQFLCCAAAYADFVAAERKFGDYLQRARKRYPENAVTVTTLPGLVEQLGTTRLV
jgi:hypothetical protein